MFHFIIEPPRGQWFFPACCDRMYPKEVNAVDLYTILEQLQIAYEEVSHPAVYTVEQAHALGRLLDGMDCKNLFLRDGKKRAYFLASFPAQKPVDLKELSAKLGVKGLSFASPSDLESMLGLIPGSVTPFGIIHDRENRVKVVLDSDFVGQMLLFHPKTNTKTISISYADLIRFIEDQGHSWMIL